MVSLYGAYIYVENIMSGLEKDEVWPFVTGKFIFDTCKCDKDDTRLLLIVNLGKRLNQVMILPTICHRM